MNLVKWIAVMVVGLLFIGCATTPDRHTEEQVPQMSNAQLVAEYQSNVNQVFKSANNLQKANEKLATGELTSGIATSIMMATMQSHGKAAYMECEKLKVELTKRGYTFDNDGNIYEPTQQAQSTPAVTPVVAKEDIVK